MLFKTSQKRKVCADGRRGGELLVGERLIWRVVGLARAGRSRAKIVGRESGVGPRWGRSGLQVGLGLVTLIVSVFFFTTCKRFNRDRDRDV
jgi:hypothetical protein